MSDMRVPRDREDFHRTLRRDRLEAVVWAAFGFVFFLMTLSFDKPLLHYRLGAAFWPQIVLGGIILFAAVLFVSTFLTKQRSDGAEAGHSLGEAMQDKAFPLSARLVLILLVPLVWTLAMRWFGFPLTAPVFLVAFLWLIGVRRLGAILAYTVIFDGALMLLFYKFIFTPLPQGAGWFYTLNGHIIGLMQ